MHDQACLYLQHDFDSLSLQDRDALQAKGCLLTSNLVEIAENLTKRRFGCAVLFAREFSLQADKYLRAMSEHLVFQSQYIILVSPEPDTKLLGLAYELGVKNTWPVEGFVSRFAAWANEKETELSDDDNTDKDLSPFAQALAARDVGLAETRIGPIVEASVYDFRAAFLLGQLASLKKDPAAAATHFAKAQELNPYFLPSLVQSAQVKLASGQAAEAVAVLERLEQVNRYNPDRKVQMAQAYVELKDFAQAQTCLASARELDPGNVKAKEFAVSLAFESGNVEDALAQLTKFNMAGDGFLSRLNNHAVELAKQGQFEAALLVYERAHQIAPPKSRFRISYNIALACRKQGSLDKALDYAKQCMSEPGGQGFDKVLKLRQQIEEDMKK